MANSPEMVRSSHRTPPQTSEVVPADEIRTIMLNQVAWGAVFAGAAIALVIQIILNMIGLGVGLSTVDVGEGSTPSASSMSVGAGIWFVVSGIVAAALGGYIAGRLSGKASASTTAYHGLMSWAVSTLAVMYLLSSAASGIAGGALSTASSALGGAGKALGGSVQTAVQTAAPTLNNVSDPMAAIESKVRGASGGQDPAALRDAAATAVRAALTGDASQQAAANDKAAEALAKAQNISQDEAKAQISQYQQQYKEAVAKTKEQAKQAADTAAKRVSQGALFAAVALLVGALAAFFAGQAGAVNPTVSAQVARH
ncbi:MULTISPECIES: PhnA-like protein [unclassified Bradyrhizobium]|uniref:PhnA-like protein n=1 Tax=unclassified Bradyrhizobium TaxID=2631580 RepID=UPI001CD22D78|nr:MULTISPECIES: PhnA-like protein [unclassified Bradyrhizobium]